MATVFPHATTSEAMQEAALAAYGYAIHIQSVDRGRIAMAEISARASFRSAFRTALLRR